MHYGEGDKRVLRWPKPQTQLMGVYPVWNTHSQEWLWQARMLDSRDRALLLGTFRSESDAADRFRARFLEEYGREPARLRADFTGYPRGGKILLNWNPHAPPIRTKSKKGHPTVRNDLTRDEDGNVWLRMFWADDRESAVMVDEDVYHDRLNLYRWKPKTTAPEHEFYITASCVVRHFDGGSHGTTRNLGQMILGNPLGTRVYQKNRNPRDYRLENLTLDPFERVDVGTNRVPPLPPRIFLAPPIYPQPNGERGAYRLPNHTDIPPEALPLEQAIAAAEQNGGAGGDQLAAPAPPPEIRDEVAAAVERKLAAAALFTPEPEVEQAERAARVEAALEQVALERAALERALGRAVTGTPEPPTSTDAPTGEQTPQKPVYEPTAASAGGDQIPVFYVLQAAPDLDPDLVRLGCTGDVEAELAAARGDHRTARLLGTWPIRAYWAATLIDYLIWGGVERLTDEVYRMPVDILQARIAAFLEQMPRL